MDKRHLNWCNQHSWDIDYIYLNDGSIFLFCNYENKEIEFKSFQSLRDWAGY